MNNYTNVVGAGNLAFFCYSKISELNTFYCDPLYGLDNAVRSGNAMEPFQSVAYAATRVTAAGMIIHAKEGIYNETAQIVLALGVSLKGEGIGKTVINSTYAATDNGSITMTSPVADPVDGNQSVHDLTLNGVALTGHVGIVSGYRNNVLIYNVRVEDFDRSGIRFISDDVYPNPPTVAYAEGNGVLNSYIINCGYYNSSHAALWFNGQCHFKNVNNRFDNTARAAGSNSWATVKMNWNEAYLFEGCSLTRLDHELGNWNFFVENWNYEGGCIIRSNTFYGLAGVDLGGNNNDRKAGYLYGLRMYDNQFINAANGNRTNGGFTHLNNAICIEGQGHKYLQVFNNKIQRYGIGISLQTSNLAVDYLMQHIKIYSNEISNVGYADYAFSYGIQWLNETPAALHSNVSEFCDIVNNTVTANPALATFLGIGMYCNGEFRYNKVQNNIVANFDDHAIRLVEHAADTLNVTGCRLTYNDMFNNGTDAVDFSATASVDNDILTGNFADDPQFLGADDFHLFRGSPCQQAALPILYVTSDMDGNDIVVQPTIGCYQLN